jgi:hypothetical protein
MSGKLDILAAVLFVVGFTAMTTTFALLLARIRKQIVVTKRRGRRFWQLALMLFGVALVACSQFIFWFDSSLSDYMAFNDREPLAEVTFHTAEDLGRIMTVSYKAPKSGTTIANDVTLESEIAVLELETIRFSKTLAFLDLGKYCRISSVRQIEQMEMNTSIDQVIEFQPDSGKLWSFLKTVSQVLPVAKAERDFSEPMFFQEGERVQIFASEEGFSFVSYP